MSEMTRPELVEAVLAVVLREMCAYGQGWRNSWIDFDGRMLRNQLDAVAVWAEKTLKDKVLVDYREGSEFEEREL